MKNYLKSFRQSAGFTLIELLVVIGILGILAAALVATIDPFEQLNKAQDANVKNTTVEYIDANIRYYTTHQAMPWGDANAPLACQNSGTAPSGLALTTGQMTSCTSALLADNELKQSFSTAVNILGKIFVTAGANNSVIACFAPISHSQQRDPNTKYTITGGAVANPGVNCVGYGGATTCYWCTQ